MCVRQLQYEKDGQTIDGVCSTYLCDIKPGDKVKLVVPGGGGYGKPEKRERERIEEDINEGFVSEEAAVSDYNF